MNELKEHKEGTGNVWPGTLCFQEQRQIEKSGNIGVYV